MRQAARRGARAAGGPTAAAVASLSAAAAAVAATTDSKPQDGYAVAAAEVMAAAAAASRARAEAADNALGAVVAAHHRAATAAAPGGPAGRSGRNIAAENLAIRAAAAAAAHPTGGLPPVEETAPVVIDAGATAGAVALYTLRGGRPGAPTWVCTTESADAMMREVAAVAVTRGCAPRVADAVHEAVAAAAAADTQGYSWFVISDATPDSVASYLEKRLNLEVPDAALAARGMVPANDAAASAAAAAAPEPSAVPLMVVFDRFSSTRDKYFLDVDVAAAAAAAAALPAAPSDADLMLASLPTPAAIAAWLARVAAGEVSPTLLGAPRPAGDAYPGIPDLALVVSDSFADIVLDPSRDVVLEAYMTDCPMCMALAARVRMLATLAARHFPWVRVGAMNIDDNDRPVRLLGGGVGGTHTHRHARTHTLTSYPHPHPISAARMDAGAGVPHHPAVQCRRRRRQQVVWCGMRGGACSFAGDCACRCQWAAALWTGGVRQPAVRAVVGLL